MELPRFHLSLLLLFCAFAGAALGLYFDSANWRLVESRSFDLNQPAPPDYKTNEFVRKSFDLGGTVVHKYEGVFTSEEEIFSRGSTPPVWIRNCSDGKVRQTIDIPRMIHRIDLTADYMTFTIYHHDGYCRYQRSRGYGIQFGSFKLWLVIVLYFAFVFEFFRSLFNSVNKKKVPAS